MKGTGRSSSVQRMACSALQCARGEVAAGNGLWGCACLTELRALASLNPLPFT